MNEPSTPQSQHLVPSGVMRVPEPGGGSQGARGRSVAGDNIEGALSSSPQHGDKATSPSSPGLSSALGGAGVSLTPVPGDPAGPGGPSSSRVLGSHTPPHILGRSQSVDGHPVVPSSTPQPPSPWKKAFSASSVSRGRDAWPPCHTSSALCQGDWEVRAVLGGAARPLPTSMATTALSLKSWEPTEPPASVGAGKGLVWGGGCMGETNTSLIPRAYSPLPA